LLKQGLWQASTTVILEHWGGEIMGFDKIVQGLTAKILDRDVKK